ncbi:hypothetical protein ACF0H5_023588 [Mactra antiquata]
MCRRTKMTMSNSFREVTVCLSIMTIICACAKAYPATFSDQMRFGELNSFIDQLKKELNLGEHAQVKNTIESTLDNSNRDAMHPGTGSSFQTLNMGHKQDSQSKPLLSALLLKNDDDVTRYDVSKRQGSWDYDYGLGGGRFGKRAGYWADYSLGGGRFGRDVDHVANMAVEDIPDIEDTTE